jgi:hypothetical protein
MVCRSLMLELHRAGMIELPAVRQKSPNPLAVRHKPAPVEVVLTPPARRSSVWASSAPDRDGNRTPAST